MHQDSSVPWALASSLLSVSVSVSPSPPPLLSPPFFSTCCDACTFLPLLPRRPVSACSMPLPPCPLGRTRAKRKDASVCVLVDHVSTRPSCRPHSGACAFLLRQRSPKMECPAGKRFTASLWITRSATSHTCKVDTLVLLLPSCRAPSRSSCLRVAGSNGPSRRRRRRAKGTLAHDAMRHQALTLPASTLRLAPTPASALSARRAPTCCVADCLDETPRSGQRIKKDEVGCIRCARWWPSSLLELHAAG